MASTIGPLPSGLPPVTGGETDAEPSSTSSTGDPSPFPHTALVDWLRATPEYPARSDHARTSTTYRVKDSTADQSVAVVMKAATSASTLEEVVQVLGTAPDENGSGGSGIRALPRSLQAGPTAALNGTLLRLSLKQSAEQRAKAAAVLAAHTVESGEDPRALECLTHNIFVIGDGPDATTAIRTLWAPVNRMPLQNRGTALYGLTTSIDLFPYSERPERFREHLVAWEQLVEADPSALRSTPTYNSPFDSVLPNMVDKLPVDFQPEARERIAAMKAAVENSKSDFPPSGDDYRHSPNHSFWASLSTLRPTPSFAPLPTPTPSFAPLPTPTRRPATGQVDAGEVERLLERIGLIDRARPAVSGDVEPSDAPTTAIEIRNKGTIAVREPGPKKE